MTSHPSDVPHGGQPDLHAQCGPAGRAVDPGIPAANRVEVVLVDDHPLFTQGLTLLLRTATGGRITVVGCTGQASMAVELVRRHRPDVALVDLAMPPPGGLAALRSLRAAHPGVRLLALSGITDAEVAIASLRAGADGFLPKAVEPGLLLHPLLAALEGWGVVPAPLLARLADGASRPGSAVLDDLDADERRLWRRVAQGASTSDLARELLVSERTAKRLVAGLLGRIGAANRVHAAALAGRSGLLDR